jgi:hypothetical protein
MTTFKVGDHVWDDLTKCIVEILKVDVSQNGSIGYFVNSDYLGGGRHPWELSELGGKKGLTQ